MRITLPHWLSLTLWFLMGVALLTGCGGSSVIPTVQTPVETSFTSPIKSDSEPLLFTSPLSDAEISKQATSMVKSAADFGLGGQIVFHSKRSGNFDIWLMNADGSDQRQLTNDPALDVEPAWGPGGKHIVFVTARDDPLKLSLYVMDADGGDQHKLVSTPGGLCMGPVWSPDRARIAFFSNVDGNFELYIVNADGTDLTNLTNNPANDSRPSWSPDGKRLVFVSDRDDGENIYILDLSSGTVTRLTTGYYTDNLPHWSPDSKTILFESNRAGIKGLFTVPTSGGTPTPVLTPPQGDDSPAWAANGQFIVFSSERTGDWELYILRTGSNDTHQLTLSKGMDRFPAWTP